MITAILQFRFLRACLAVAGFLLAGSMAKAQFQAHDEKKAEALRVMGDAEYDRGHFDRAKAYYIDANTYNNTDAKTMLGLAKIAEQKGDLDEAIRRARLATQYEPASADVHVVMASFLQANQDFRGAELQYERAIDLTKSKDDSVLFCSKAIKSLVELEDFERADKLSKLWLTQHAKYAQSHYDRGLVLMHSSKPKNQEEALKQFNQALAIDPNLHLAHLQLGVLAGKADQKQTALKELNIFIESKPGPKDLKLAKEEVEKLTAQ